MVQGLTAHRSNHASVYYRIASALCVGALATLILMSASAGASAPDSAVTVLHQETRWLNAIVGGDAKARAIGENLARERYTDVYVKENGTWMALSAQETQIAP